MPSEISIPKALYQANIDLALRIAALLQENGKQWFDLFSEEAEVCMDERMVQADELGHAPLLERLAALPTDAMAHFMGTDLERWQAVLAHVVDSQSHFSSGLQAALQDWQSACTQAFGHASGGALPEAMSQALPGLNDILGAFQQMMNQVLPSAETPAAPPASAPSGKPAAPARKPTLRPERGAAKRRSKAAPSASAGSQKASPGAAKKVAKSPVKGTAKPARKAASKRVADTAARPGPAAARSGRSARGKRA